MQLLTAHLCLFRKHTSFNRCRKTTHSWLLAPWGPDKTHPAWPHLYCKRMEARVCVCVFPVCSCAISLHFYACRLDSLSSIKVQSRRQYKFLYTYHSFTARLSLTNGFCWFSQNTRGQLQTVSLARNILLPLLSKLRVFTISPPHGPQSKQRWLCQTHTVYHICFLTYITFYFTINLCHKSESQQQQQQQHAAETEGQQRVDLGGLRLPVFPPWVTGLNYSAKWSDATKLTVLSWLVLGFSWIYWLMETPATFYVQGKRRDSDKLEECYAGSPLQVLLNVGNP